jgi:hypothetical protein
VELVRIDQREPSEHPRINPVAFGVALIVAAQVGNLLTVDQVDWNRLPRIIHGHGKPGHAGRFHHDLHLGRGCALTRPREQVRELAGLSVDGEDRGAEVSGLVENDRFVSGLDGQVETNRAHTTCFHMA